MTPTSAKDPDALGSKTLSIALIGPEEFRRQPIASALASLQGGVTREFSFYPELDDVPRLLESDYDVIIVELDSNPEYALELVENICGNSSITVMVYSAQVYPDMLVRCMRAGAREFLTHPVTPATIAEAMVRASVRRPAVRVEKKKVGGKVLIFVGAKGGSGVTTIASNFAVSLAQEPDKSAILIDLNLPLGNAAVELGIASQFSVVNALQSATDLDSNFLAKLLVKHSSGLYVLGAPDSYTQAQASNEAVEKLLSVAKQEFDYVVVDAGSRFGPIAKALFQQGVTVYLVVQVSISELRNSNRLITDLFKVTGVELEIVLNRYTSKVLGIDENGINKALTMPAKWKIPSDYPAVSTAQNTAVPLVLKDSPISKVIRKMTGTVTGSSEGQEKKRRFNLFG
jgi:pilus assembly protein CpaE